MNDNFTTSSEETLQEIINHVMNVKQPEQQCITNVEDEQSQNSLPMRINLSKEILKVVLALCALKLPVHPVLHKENKATQTDDLNYSPSSSNYNRLTSSCVSLSQMADSIFSSSRKPFKNDSQQITTNPFIRVVTHKNGVLIHLGQLISILKDQKSFIMRNVISFDPLRVHERTISTLQPSEILALTESKLQSQQGKRGNLLSEYLQNQLMTNLGEKSSSSSEKNKPMNLAEQKQEAVHGPLLITPGDVLICLNEVRELSIVPVMRFDQPKQMRQTNVKSEFKRITEVKQHDFSQDMLTISKLTESVGKEADLPLQPVEPTDIVDSSNSVDAPYSISQSPDEIISDDSSNRKQTDQKCIKKPSLKKAWSEAKDTANEVQGGEKSNSLKKHLKFYENGPTTKMNNSSIDGQDGHQKQPPLRRQVLQEHEEKKVENFKSANKTNRRNSSTESRRRRREKQRHINKQRYSEVDMKTYTKLDGISSASFLNCPTSTPHLTNSPMEHSSCKWDDDGIVSITIHQSLNSTIQNHSNNLPKRRQKLSLQKEV
ncbi:hypothetical protein MN116_008092 [Schistosoma mekongi]|uniref:Uncharacterized protein n=1 Tax=Schistosoma mekongi TaxID=38744 RepID=A0AAE1Z794_SCHME|nr:hypothetical protein MN116_008092 [Schistosoma mekongi]